MQCKMAAKAKHNMMLLDCGIKWLSDKHIHKSWHNLIGADILGKLRIDQGNIHIGITHVDTETERRLALPP